MARMCEGSGRGISGRQRGREEGGKETKWTGQQAGEAAFASLRGQGGGGIGAARRSKEGTVAVYTILFLPRRGDNG